MYTNPEQREEARLALNIIYGMLERGKIIGQNGRTVNMNNALHFAALELERHNFEKEYKILRYLYLNDGATIFCDVHTVGALKAAYRLIKAQLDEEHTESLKEAEE